MRCSNATLSPASRACPTCAVRDASRACPTCAVRDASRACPTCAIKQAQPGSILVAWGEGEGSLRRGGGSLGVLDALGAEFVTLLAVKPFLIGLLGARDGFGAA